GRAAGGRPRSIRWARAEGRRGRWQRSRRGRRPSRSISRVWVTVGVTASRQFGLTFPSTVPSDELPDAGERISARVAVPVVLHSGRDALRGPGSARLLD